MKTKLLLAALAATLAAPAFASTSASALSLEEIVAITGMEKREVQLMLGAYSNNPYYRTAFYRVSREWHSAVREHDLLVEAVARGDGSVAFEVRRRAGSNG